MDLSKEELEILGQALYMLDTDDFYWDNKDADYSKIAAKLMDKIGEKYKTP